MTADHPTREERITGHRYDVMDGLGGQWLVETCDQYPEPSPVGRVDDLLAASALVAADPAPAQPDAGLNDDGREALWEAVVRERILAARAVQPVPAPERKDMAWDNLPAPEVSRGVAEACGCFACIGNEPAYPGTWLTVGMTRMILCSKCGNKRCPHGTDHRNACTGSNEPGQVGSRYGSALPTDDGADCCRERTTAGGCGCGGES